MNLPVWLTVLISGFISDWLGPKIAVLVLLPTLLSGTGDKQLAAHYMLVVLVSAIVQVALTSLILYLLLHPLSSARASYLTTFVATLIGRGILVGGTLLLLRSSTQANLAAGGGVGLMAGIGLFSILLFVLSVFVTSTLIQDSDAIGGGGGGSRFDLYGGKAYLDEYRQQGDQS